MKRKIQLIIIIILLFPCFLIGNNNLSDSTLHKIIKLEVVSNMLYYKIDNYKKIGGNFIVDNDDYFSIRNYFICKLDFEIKKADIEYPDTTITLYSISKYWNDSDDCGNAIQPRWACFDYDQYFLIGVLQSGFVKYFISGNFNQSSIKHHFALDFTKPESFYNYIKIKTFQFQTRDIEFIKEKDEELIFKAYSEVTDEKTIYIIIEKNNLDKFYYKIGDMNSKRLTIEDLQQIHECIGNNNLSDLIILKNIEEDILINILIYRIRHAIHVNNKFDGNFLKDNGNFNDIKNYFECKLKFEIKKADIEYPDTTITLYSIYKKGDNYDCGSVIIQPSWSFFDYDDYFLVGVSKNGFVKYFISGNFHQHKIKHDFSLNFKKPESFYNYIKIKAFQFQIKDLEFIKKQGEELIFKAYSEVMKETIHVIIEKNNLDIIYYQIKDYPKTNDLQRAW